MFQFPAGAMMGVFSFTIMSRLALVPTSLLPNGYQGLLPWG